MSCNTINQLLSKVDKHAGIHPTMSSELCKSLMQEAYELGKRHGRREMLCDQSKATRNIECKS